MDDLLIITNSYDVTTDVLLGGLRGESVFRFNFDQIMSYRLVINEHGFTISDPTGRSTCSQSVKKAYWRKPFNAELEDAEVCSKYVTAELRYALSELVNLLWLDQKLVLVEPHAERRTGKLVQLHKARGLFNVPAYEFMLNSEPRSFDAVVKSLSNELIDDRILFTTKVDPAALDLRYPWYLQALVGGKQDVTVVFIRGQMFAFALDRDFLDKSVDWRESVSPEQKWAVHKLPEAMQEAINTYMACLRLDYGRLDFLLDADARYWFCEVNPNGQFAWLDLTGELGVLNAVLQEISPSSPTRAIPNHHALAELNSEVSGGDAITLVRP